MKASATTVSRALRAAGFLMVSNSLREGMRVRRLLFGSVSVTAQIDTEPIALLRATEAAVVLRDLGYTVEQTGARLRVTR